VDGDEASHGKLVANPIQTKLGRYLGPHLLFLGTIAMASRIFSAMAVHPAESLADLAAKSE
jgi:hypothetical protein